MGEVCNTHLGSGKFVRKFSLENPKEITFHQRVLQVMFPSAFSFIVLVFTVSLHISAYIAIFNCVGYFIFICLKDSASLLLSAFFFFSRGHTLHVSIVFSLCALFSFVILVVSLCVWLLALSLLFVTLYVLSLCIPELRCVNIIQPKKNVIYKGKKEVDWVQLAQNTGLLRASVNTIK
jgi:hypothetical protein